MHIWNLEAGVVCLPGIANKHLLLYVAITPAFSWELHPSHHPYHMATVEAACAFPRVINPEMITESFSEPFHIGTGKNSL